MKTNNTFSRHETGLVRVLGFIYLTIIFGSYYIEYESNLGNKFSPKIDILAMSIFFLPGRIVFSRLHAYTKDW